MVNENFGSGSGVEERKKVVLGFDVTVENVLESESRPHVRGVECEYLTSVVIFHPSVAA